MTAEGDRTPGPRIRRRRSSSIPTSGQKCTITVIRDIHLTGLFAGCATATKGPQAQPSPAPPVAAIDPYVALEEKYDARIGVFAIDTGTGAELNHQADERFAFCSTYKTLAAAAILRQTSPTQLNASLTYTAADVLAHSPITEQHVATGMTIRACVRPLFATATTPQRTSWCAR